jgi:hypothetical protein
MTKSNDTARRFLRLSSGAEFEIGRVTAIKVDIPTLFTIEAMKDGKYRITYNATRIQNLSDIEGISIRRET